MYSTNIEMSGERHSENVKLSRSLSSDLHNTISSSIGSDYRRNTPVPLGEEDLEKDTLRKSESHGSYHTSNSMGRRKRSLRKVSSSGESEHTEHSLSRYNTSYSVKEIYGDKSEREIELERTKTRNTILTELSHRVDTENEYNKGDVSDEEKQSLAQRDEHLYEDIDDVPVPTKDNGAEFTDIDPELVTWDGDDDPEHPRNWPVSQKCWQTFIVAIYTLISPMSSSVCSPAMGKIAKDFGMHSTILQAFSVSIMVLAWALGPIFIAPLSESDKIGRRTVLNVSIWIIFIFNLVCGFAKNTAQLCVFRFLGGLGGCAALNVGAGTLADLWDNKPRQFAMAAYSLGPQLGPVISPVISGFIVENCAWKWVFFVLAIFNGAVAALGTIFFRETYSPKLLRQKADRLRKETGNSHLHTIYEMANANKNMKTVISTMTRPLGMLVTNPMILGLGSFMAFIYGFMYLMIVTFPRVFEGSYGFSVGITGLMFLPMGLGYVLATAFWTWLIDRFYAKLTERNNGVPKPEYRLPCLCFSGVGTAVGLIWYGWSAQKKLHWIMPCIGSGLFAFFLTAVFQTIQNYLIDMNPRLSASAIAAAAIMRSVFGFALPLAANAMYNRLNYGWGNTMCGFLALALGVPFPLFCLKYGEYLRNWANRRANRSLANLEKENFDRLKAKNGSAEPPVPPAAKTAAKTTS